MLEGGNTREECECESVGVKGDGSVRRRAGGVVPVVAVDSGTEEEEISASCSSPRWQENKLWEDDGAVMALAGDGESGSVSMPEERVVWLVERRRWSGVWLTNGSLLPLLMCRIWLVRVIQ
ncbi:hypothetical protein V6N13_074409 [Hibiscus sabdariffa]